MDFKKVLELLLREFNKNSIESALIGGFALHAAGVIRATVDIDFLVYKIDTDKIDNIMKKYDYELTNKCEDFANYYSHLKPLGNVGFLYAHRTYAIEMLKRSKEYIFFDAKLKIKVVIPEDIIGLKIQSISNNPDRYTQDMVDIVNIIKVNINSLNMGLVRDYFKLFNREKDLDELLDRIKNTGISQGSKQNTIYSILSDKNKEEMIRDAFDENKRKQFYISKRLVDAQIRSRYFPIEEYISFLKNIQEMFSTTKSHKKTLHYHIAKI